MNKDHGFRQRMLNKTDDELLTMVQADRNNYQREALLDAESILRERGVAFVSLEEEKDPVQQTIDYTYWPGIVGALMVIAAFGIFSVRIDQGSATAVNVFVTVLFRIIVVAWMYDLCTKHEMKKGIWITLGILFGGWALIAINIAIATSQSPDDSKATLFGVPPEDEQDTPSPQS